MIERAGKYTTIRREANDQRKARRDWPVPNVLIKMPTQKLVDIGDWFCRELREGSWFHEYHRRRKWRAREKEMPLVRAKWRDYRPNPKSEFQLMASVPASMYYSWYMEDEYFWDDDSNYKLLKRGDPDVMVFV